MQARALGPNSLVSTQRPVQEAAHEPVVQPTVGLPENPWPQVALQLPPLAVLSQPPAGSTAFGGFVGSAAEGQPVGWEGRAPRCQGEGQETQVQSNLRPTGLRWELRRVCAAPLCPSAHSWVCRSRSRTGAMSPRRRW